LFSLAMRKENSPAQTNFMSRKVIAAAVMFIALLAAFLFFRKEPMGQKSKDQLASESTRPTKRHLARPDPDQPKPSDRDGQSDTQPSFGDIPRAQTSLNQSGTIKKEKPDHWKPTLPPAVASIPPGVVVTPPEVVVNVDGRRHLPKFQGPFSDRMEISSKGNAAFSVVWPPEHKTDQILVSAINDGEINGEPGAVVQKGEDGRFRFNFQAGPHSGATQVLLTSATLSYTLNFWVPTGNPNVDPPMLR
jgi:hypothetical protein